MDTTAAMKKAIADRKIHLAESLKVLDAAVKESRTTRQKRMAEQRRTE